MEDRSQKREDASTGFMHRSIYRPLGTRGSHPKYLAQSNLTAPSNQSAKPKITFLRCEHRIRILRLRFMLRHGGVGSRADRMYSTVHATAKGGAYDFPLFGYRRWPCWPCWPIWPIPPRPAFRQTATGLAQLSISWTLGYLDNHLADGIVDKTEALDAKVLYL